MSTNMKIRPAEHRLSEPAIGYPGSTINVS
jgi:hypothetical protein